MTDRELMQEALYALTYVGDAKEIYSDTIESLRARLAQPEEPDWSAAGFSKPPTHSEAWWKHEVSNAYANGYEKGRASVKQPEQEPVAWADKYDLDREGHDFWVSRQANVRTGVPLYTAPPQRDEAPAKAVEWQGLTQEDKREIIDETEPEDRGYVMALVEAKLKDKNNAV